MSRIFEALQRSESERIDFTFPEPPELIPETQAAEPEQREEPEQAPRAVQSFPQFPVARINLTPDSRLVALTEREGLAAEKFRFLSVRLRQLQQGKGLKKLLITSTLPGEGKSLISANLAATLARRKQQKVLLIEGDLRRPAQTLQLGVPGLAGLTEWLRDAARPVGNIYFLEGAGFWFLPAGSTPENPLELMQSGRLPGLLEQLGAWFDWIVIDSPPLLPLADTSVWSRLSDGIVLVTREGHTERQQLQRGLGVLERSRLLGVVVNSCSDTHHQDYYSQYTYAASAHEPSER
jgi:protein-tyrosine kinase